MIRCLCAPLLNMIFEIPLDHFPAQQQATKGPTRPLRLTNNAIQEVSQAVAVPPSPQVKKGAFSFTTTEKRSVPTLRATIPPLKRAFTSPALPVQHLNLTNLRKASTPSSTHSITEMLKSDFLKMPSRLLCQAVSLHQLA
ncbi:unnamed protein product [Caenorhabditis bovis]|uniref:Uncharacterized protein n=1 Tax=Caenorhabditis bovis TaxID=2654633 RepID=A0A8S1EAW0_9PELO|nr:unnamed protein product [Caenorhabditis bovis]